jgi:hypothetical protein
MKKMKKILIIALSVFVMSACTDLTELNKDIKNPQEVSAGSLFANATKELFDFMVSTNVNENNFRLWSQHWAQTTYSDESNYDLVTRNVNGRAWDAMYSTVIKDLREAKLAIAANDLLTTEQRNNQNAMCDVMEVFAFHVLTDIFGDIPYTTALGEDVTPGYDDDAAIYTDLIARLTAASNTFAGESNMGGADLIYGGDVMMWKKFTNSLKLRLAIRIADANNAAAKTAAEQAIAAGVFTSSADDFKLQYANSTPNTNPLWVDLVQSGRSDFIAANTLGDYLNLLNDPRRSAFFSGPVDSVGGVIGGIYGNSNSYNSNSQPGTVLKEPTLPGVILSYTEVAFLLADATERGYNTGATAESFYNAGVESSILEWGGVAGDAAAYLAQADVAYSTAPGDWKAKIAKQKWIALYNRGFEAWSTYRLYDAPTLNIATGAGVPTPARYTYPVSEYTLNGASVASAAGAMGGDELDTKIFWDKN